MRQPTYLSKFTLKDYIAGLVRKDSEEKVKSNSSLLSAEARPFHPIKACYILVSSLESNISFTIPVYPPVYSLSLSTLRKYFPLAINMYYIQNGQMIILATSKNYNIGMNTDMEFSELKFFIPDSCHQYFVSEHGEVDRNRLFETSMEDTVKCVEGIKCKLRSTMAEVEKLEEEVIELQKLLRDQASETLVKLPNNECVYDIGQNYLEAVDAYAYGEDADLLVNMQ